jgi:hypothetical protein
LSRGVGVGGHQRFQEYEDGRDGQKTEKNRGVFCRRAGPTRGCSAKYRIESITGDLICG